MIFARVVRKTGARGVVSPSPTKTAPRVVAWTSIEAKVGRDDELHPPAAGVVVLLVDVVVAVVLVDPFVEFVVLLDVDVDVVVVVVLLDPRVLVVPPPDS